MIQLKNRFLDPHGKSYILPFSCLLSSYFILSIKNISFNKIMIKILSSINFFFDKLVLLICIFFSSYCFSKGDLTRQNPVEIEVLLKGKTGENHFYDPSLLKFETGKLYKLKLINISDSKHYFSSTNFANSIFTRKIQVIKNKNKIAEIKGHIKEVEIFPENIVEWWFVPVKTGVFKDLFCHVKDEISEVSHADMGMIGTIIIE